MGGLIILGISIVFALFFAISPVFAQESVDMSKQITLSGDLKNNPIAQDILKKIEKSKRWIAQMEQRNFETQERQKELEEKRTEVLQILEKDLKKWEDLWGYYTFDKILERVLENSPANSTSTIYDHPLKFTASKINAGRDALHKVLLEGGGPEEARTAFVNAAKITREEMIYANSLYNILQNNAYYNQQILFSSSGTFEDSISGKELRKYYQDYRTNPGYLQANPFDKLSWTDLGKNTPDTECREEHVLVYRTNADDYVCTTKQTAEMWVRHNMGNLVNDTFLESQDPVSVKQFKEDRVLKKVDNLNSKIDMLQRHYEKKLSDMKIKYASLFVNLKFEQNGEEKKLITKFNSNDKMSKKTFTANILDIQGKYAQLESNITDEKSRILELLENQYQTGVHNFVKNYEFDSEIKIIWNSQNPVFHANVPLS